MATIEPRLIHLLNESSSTPRPHHTELPPIKGLSFPAVYPPHHHPLPLEPDAGPRSDASDGQLPAQASSIPPLYGPEDSSPSANGPTAAGSSAARRDGQLSPPSDRPLLRTISSQDLRMILESPAGDDLATKKRTVKDDYVQLPQPLKKQKATVQHQQQQHVFPPIIVGILEPPMNHSAALFPPISSDRPHSEPPQAPGVASPPPETQSPPQENITPPDPDRTITGKARQRRAPKPRRKWTEAETNHLLLGVSKHGVGRWTDILEDPDYVFNDRSAGDLKDRFRTCCPEELRASLLAKRDLPSPGSSPTSTSPTASVMPTPVPSTPVAKPPKTGIMSENILNEVEEDVEGEAAGNPDSDKQPQAQRKSRAHRKKMEDLAELGIKGPFKKSHRRERKPFSEQDDREILEGYEMYGPQWTKIQRDPRFHLSNRQPTDLRDRLRNKFPGKIGVVEKTPGQGKEGTTSNRSSIPSDSSPSREMDTSGPASSRAAPLQPQLHRTSSSLSKEDLPKWPPAPNEVPQPHSGMYWNDHGGAGFGSGGMGEMDISRLLLDDAQQK